jgi:GDP-L-fucose synthase
MMNFWKGKNVVVTGGAGFLGSHLVDLLHENKCKPFVPRCQDYDLRYPVDISRMYQDAGAVDVLFNLAANVGGIGYNRAHPYALYYDNAIMATQVIHHAILQGVRKLVQVGTTCSYPKFCPAPFDERSLWDGYPEETNAPYGLAKRNLLVQLQAARAEFGFNGIYLIPTNLYGPRDEFGPERSHVIPALIGRCVEARENGRDSVTVWGTGRATRDFLYVRDAAEALLAAAERYNRPEPLNVGSGEEVTIAYLLHLIKELTGFKGREDWDMTKPDGQPRRKLSVGATRQALGWEAKTPLRGGLEETIRWYEERRREGAVYNERRIG